MSKKQFQPAISSSRVLVSKARLAASHESDELLQIPVDSIVPNPMQPRTTDYPVDFENLKNSIREHGILEPLIGRVEAGGTCTLIAGHRRLRAALEIGFASVPVIRKHIPDSKLLETALIENMQRGGLHPVDEARALDKVAAQYADQLKAAQALGLPRPTFSNRIRILALSDEILARCLCIPEMSYNMLHQLVRTPVEQREAVLCRFEGKAAEVKSVETVSKPEKPGFRFRTKLKNPVTNVPERVRLTLQVGNRPLDLVESIPYLRRVLKKLEEEQLQCSSSNIAEK